jgi:aminopeptidase N
LNWFFNQWYFGNGHPYVSITQKYDATLQQIMVKISQTQIQNKLFELPIGIDVDVNGKRNHYEVWSKNKVDSFYFPAASEPDNVNVDNDKILLWEKNDSKPLKQFIYQYYHASNFLDRNEALNEVSQNLKSKEAMQLIQDAIRDSFYVIRAKAIHSLNPSSIDENLEKTIYTIAKTDPSNLVREEAINTLAVLSKEVYKNDFILWCKDSSYTIAGAALEALETIDSNMAFQIAKTASKHLIKKRLNTVVTKLLTKYGDESDFDFIANKYESLNIQSEDKFQMTQPFATLLMKTKDPVNFKRGIEIIVAFRNAIPSEYRTQTDPYFNIKILGEILKVKKQKGELELTKLVTAVLPVLN